ncbi:MAG: exodeoxyribonuclease VII small subunit [Anaerolineaceae bacterium]|nr:exodeoxyribonuclease VII small subunit [Anaerolineaceae bacterium]MDE0330110.1 exodeoxyribonuclease VII small subunit [Anaerolineaceae bacterium]
MSDMAERSFEEAWAELEGILERLERGDLTLDESVALFERGRALAAHCQQLLDQAELRVRELSGMAEENGGAAPTE